MESFKGLPTLDFSFKRYTQVVLEWSSINVMNHLVFDKLLTYDGP